MLTAEPKEETAHRKGARLLTTEEIDRRLASEKAELLKLARLDALIGGYSSGRQKILDRVVDLAIVRQERNLATSKQAAEERKARETAPARVTKDWADNENGYEQQCVFAECDRAEQLVEVGPVWGWGPKSVYRALAQLTARCSCGATRHVGDAG